MTHNERDSVSNHQRLYCLLNRLFRRRSKMISKLRVTGLCAGNAPGTGEFPAQMASNAENISIWWRHHVKLTYRQKTCVTTQPSVSDWFVQVPLWPSGLGVGIWNRRPGINPRTVCYTCLIHSLHRDCKRLGTVKTCVICPLDPLYQLAGIH